MAAPSGGETRPIGSGDKADSAFLSNAGYEVGIQVSGTVSRAATGEWEGLANDGALQQRLIDTQLKYGKNGMAEHGFHLNQLTDDVTIDGVEEVDGVVSIRWSATGDMVGALSGNAAPTLESLPRRDFTVSVPADPTDVRQRADTRCAEQSDVAEYNYYYYFAPAKEGCDLPLTTLSISIDEVFERRTSYPEYDRLLAADPQIEDLQVFSAALVPDTGDGSALSVFNAHEAELKRVFGIDGERSSDETYVRWTIERDGVTAHVDLFDPTKLSLTTGFARALSTYSFIAYDGHSSYGSLDLLKDAAGYSSDYQIVFMDSCRSYEYYTRQVFRAKGGWDNADVVASVMSPTFAYSGSGPIAVVDKLITGLGTIEQGEANRAPTWLEILTEVNARTGNYVIFGAAGVRTNVWTPESAPAPAPIDGEPEWTPGDGEPE